MVLPSIWHITTFFLHCQGLFIPLCALLTGSRAQRGILVCAGGNWQTLQAPSPAARLLCCVTLDCKRGALLAAGRIVVCRMSLQGRTPAARLVCCNAVDVKRGAFATGRLRRLQRRKVGVWVPIVCRVGYAEGNECGYVRDEHRARITRHNASGCLSPTTRQNATGARPWCVYARLFVLMVK